MALTNGQAYEMAKELVIERQKISISMIQRFLRIGYHQAVAAVERLERDRVVSTMGENGRRTVLCGNWRTAEYVKQRTLQVCGTFDAAEKEKMDNQHKKITGYRDLSQEEIDLMNESKELAEKCRVLIEKLESTPSTDKRNVSLAKTNLQQGFMWAVRSVAQPTTF